MNHYSYIKTTDEFTTYYIKFPVDNDLSTQTGLELGTLSDGRTIVVIFDGYTLPDQAEQVSISLQLLTLTTELKDEIKLVSPHAKLISNRMIQKIRDEYSTDDEAYFSRIGVGVALGAYTFEPGEQAALLAFGAYVESVRQWGRVERAKFGL